MTGHTYERVKKVIVPLLPLRDTVVFPHMVVPLLVGRERSIRAVESSMERDQRLFFVLQKVAKVNDPRDEDLYLIGTLGTPIQSVKLPDGTVKVLGEGECRGRLLRLIPNEPFTLAEVEEIDSFAQPSLETEALMRSLVNLFGTYGKLNQRVNSETVASMSEIEDPGRLADSMVVHVGLKLEDKQRLLEVLPPGKRLEELYRLLRTEIEILQMEQKIRERVKRQMEKNQKEYYLNEQMRAIQKELGDKDEFAQEMRDLELRIREKKMSKEATQKVEKEFKKLKMMSPMSAEATVVRNYIDWFLSLPWSHCTKDKLDLGKAEEILNEDHYGLKEVKERILEYLAVQGLVKKIKGPILCFVGPPGVGKTSLAKSIARSMGRRFVRLSLGGVRDEAEIRGHRRTYVGALPGKIIQSLKKAGSSNPVFLLDEVDKMSTDFRGDPSAALLEVLDPEQNHTFNDHYLDVDYDLSKVFFITTANILYSIPPALQDRMEVIRIAGYTEPEKVQIAQRFIVPKQIKANGLAMKNIHFSDSAVRKTIQGYTREAGVRNLEREIASICRKVAKKVLKEGKEVSVRISSGGDSKVPGSCEVPVRKGREPESDRVSQRVGLDRGRRRAPDDRGNGHAGKGQSDRYREARRGDAGIGPCGDELCPVEGRTVRSRKEFLSEARYPHSHSGGGDPEGRAFRGHHHGYGHRLGPSEGSRAKRSGHDRRDHAEGKGPSHRGAEGEDPGGPSRRNQDGPHSKGERERYQGDSDQDPEVDRAGSGRPHG